MSFDGTTAAPWDELMLRAARIVLSGFFAVLPVEITSVDELESKGCVDIYAVVRARDERGQANNIPPVACAPVLWVGTGGGYSHVHRLAVGDTGLALFSSRSMASWSVSGNVRAEPEGAQVGALHDAIFLAGLRPHTAQPAALAGIQDTGGMRIGLDDGSARLEITPTGVATLKGTQIVAESSSVLLGSTAATSFVALATLVSAELSAISAAIGTLAAGLGGAPIPNPYPSPGSVAATKVKAE